MPDVAPRTAPAAVGWTDSPTIAGEHIQPLVAQRTSEGHWLLDMFSELPIPRQGAWLSLHCGGGGLEFLAMQRGLFATLDGYDPSPQAIAAARAWVALHGVGGVRFAVGTVPDLDPARPPTTSCCRTSASTACAIWTLFWPVSTAPCVPAVGSSSTSTSGPGTSNSSPASSGSSKSCSRCCRPGCGCTGRRAGSRAAHLPPPVAHFLAHAPNEAVSSEELVPGLSARFDLESRRDYGGSILSPLLAGIVGNFNERREDELAMLRLLAAHERLLLREAALPSDFAVLVARKRATGEPADGDRQIGGSADRRIGDHRAASSV